MPPWTIPPPYRATRGRRFRASDFADRNGDGSSDIAMLFQEGDGMTLLVWFWDETAKRFVFRPEESSAASAAAWEGAA